MATRIISGIIGVIILVGIIVFMPVEATRVAVAVVAAVALYEFYKANGIMKGKKIPVVLIGYALSAVLMLEKPDFILPALCIAVMLSLASAVLWNSSIKYEDAKVAVFGSIYVPGLLMHISMLRAMDGGILLVFAAFIGAFVTDTGAYFAGVFFGKHKLIPKVSPKKTVEGSVGGILLTVIVFVVYGFVGKNGFGYEVNWLNLVIIAAVLSIVSQLGDLSASIIKREKNIKDYGNLIPGHGGALDRFDSVLFVAPAFYYLNLLMPVFVIK